MEALTHIAESRSEVLASAPAEPPKVLFVMPRLSFLRFFQSALDLMIERGLNVRLLLEGPEFDSIEEAWLRKAEACPNFVCETINHFRNEPLRDLRVGLRIGMEYVRRLGPEYSNRIAGRPRERLSLAPKLIQRLVRLPLVRTPAGIRALYGLLSVIDRAMPVQGSAARYVALADPDVLVICDKGHPGSLSSAYVKAAGTRGIPSAICVASWDNLTNRQRTRVVPDALLVWNERQREEAVEFHGVPADHVVVTGAPRFDDWFAWKPRDREEFLSRIGLQPTKPFFLWVGGALNHSAITEAEFVSRWIAALGASDDQALREAGVLIRPHPERLSEWGQSDYSAFANVAVWPREGMTFPIDVEAKADYYDSIFHAAAVVGINSSAMIEASIVGRPVLSVLIPEFHDSQFATFHFSYLVDSEGGPVRVAQSLEEHFADLAATLADRDADTPERARRFVEDFVRPHGLALPATPIFVESVEQLAQADVRPARDPLWLLPLRGLVVLVFGIAGLGRRWIRFRKQLPKAIRRLRRRIRAAPRNAANRPSVLVVRRFWRKWFDRLRSVLAPVVEAPSRIRLKRAGVLEPLTEFGRNSGLAVHRPDYSDLLLLYSLVRRRRPATVLELGTGLPTIAIATALQHNQHGRLWSVTNDAEWARAAAQALPESVRPFVEIQASARIEENRDVRGWIYQDLPAVDPDFLCLNAQSYPPKRKISFDLLELEAGLRPGCLVVVDGHDRSAWYFRKHRSRTYRYAERKPRVRQMIRLVFELAEPEPAEAPELRERTTVSSVRT